MLIDHIFISSRSQGNEAHDLLNSGFLEGSNRIHPGQGTRNRKFYFENFFLEIIWEHDREELESRLIKNTGLSDRVKFEHSEFSRFGLGLENTHDSGPVFRKCEYYQPTYFPIGTHFEILPQRENTALPWTFRGPLTGPKKANYEPLEHSNGARFLTQATFLVPERYLKSDFVRRLQGHPQLRFEAAEKTGLLLEFDAGIQGKSFDFPELDLTIRI